MRISPSTLKRIFGKLKTGERYYPQKATRNALAQFAGFKDWETFLQQNPVPHPTENIQSSEDDRKTELPAETIQEKTIKKRIWLPAILIAALIATIVWQFSEKEDIVPVNTQGIKFICKNPVGENPHSAEFIFELPQKFSGDTANFKVNFDDGRIEKKEMPGTLFTYYYEIPGRYYAVLKYNDRPIDTACVYLKTNGWTATASMMHDTTRVYPVNSNHLFKNDELSVSAHELFRAGVDTNRTFFVHFVNAKPLNINGDNFELTANVTTSPLRPGVRCSQVNIEVYGEKSEHAVEVIKPGCVTWANLRFSEIFVNGKTTDLSSIGADLSHGGIIKLRVADKKVNLFVNDKLSYQTAYHFPLHKIYGIKISFSGIGTVHNLELTDLTADNSFNEGL